MVEIEKLGLILLMAILTTTAIPYAYTQCPHSVDCQISVKLVRCLLRELLYRLSD